jgi:metallophosphoesterase superfamily enzyme
LGYSFHDWDAEARLSKADTAVIPGLTRLQDWLWIDGNHDPRLPKHLGGEGAGELRLGLLTLRHRAVGREVGEIAGDLHPKASARLRGQRLTRRCFISDDLIRAARIGADTGSDGLLTDGRMHCAADLTVERGYFGSLFKRADASHGTR